MTPVTVTQGSSPVILAFPHTGTHVPGHILATLNQEGRRLRETDWLIDALYGGLLPDATTVKATFSRYVIDANRDPTGASLYPGQTTTGLVPLTDFDDQPLWLVGCEPDAAETARRIALFHTPYHAALRAEITRVKAVHGVAILYDCHSIRPVIPWLFEGVLPDFNIGTDNGRTCDPSIERAAAEICARAERYSSVVNGRFRGGWTTRHYGDPSNGVHAIQMELTRSTYLDEADFSLHPAKAARLRPYLKAVLEALAALAPTLPGARHS